MSLSTAPERPFQHAVSQLGKFMDQMQKGYFNFSPSEVWTPAVNLYETPTGYLVCVDLAGVDKDGIDVQVQQQRLTLRGKREVPLPAPSPRSRKAKEGPRARVRMHLMEIDHGSFCREVELPVDVQQERISARYVDGLLWIELPKKA